MNCKTFLLLSLLLAGFATSCKQQPAANEEQAPAETLLKAKLRVPERVDMGEFTSEEKKKEVTIELKNVGDDTLYILAVRPECECVEATVADSTLAPQTGTTLTATLDLSDYIAPATIVKEIVITSTDFDERHIRVSLVGELKN